MCQLIVVFMKQFVHACIVTEVVLTDVGKHPPPATEPHITPPPTPDILVPQHDVISTNPHTPHPPPVTSQPRRVVPPQETSWLGSNADGIFFLSICLCIMCCLCGSPLTASCFIPAIYMSSKVDYWVMFVLTL